MSVYRSRMTGPISALLAIMALTIEAHPGDATPAGASAAPASATRVEGLIVRYRDTSRRVMVRGHEVRVAAPVEPAVMETRRQWLASRLDLPMDTLKLVRQLPTGGHLFALARPVDGELLDGRLSRLKEEDPFIEDMAPDDAMPPSVVTRSQLKGEPMFADQWNLRAIGLPQALARADGRGVVIAVLDSGRLDHPDLDGQWLPGWDFIDDPLEAGDGDGWDADPTDVPQIPGQSHDPDPWHGLQVTGVLAAKLDGRGMMGVAPGARVLPLRVTSGGGAHLSAVISALYWAVGGDVPDVPVNASPARVINMSFGGDRPCASERQLAIDFARAHGAVVVAAAGNDGAHARRLPSPANCRGVLSVANANRSRTLAKSSSRVDGITLTAPGGGQSDPGYGDILTTSNRGIRRIRKPTYARVSGTSMATPHVAGVAALMLALRPAATPDQIERALRASATPMPGCSACGAGLLNAPRALDEIQNIVDAGTNAPP